MTAATPAAARGENGRLRGAAYWIAIVASGLGLLMAINPTFHLTLLGFDPLGNSYLYYLIGMFLSLAFLAYPAWSGARERVPWYDWLLIGLTLASTIHLGRHGLEIIEQGWEYSAPRPAIIASGLLVLMALEGVRRCGGLPLLVIALVFATFPLYTEYLPGFLWGNGYNLRETVSAHAMGVESIIGIPMQVVADLVIGFVVFGAALTVTGGGEFFMRLAAALMGRSRGGPAKVAVISSALFGSLSGSVISNILTTGAFTIPTMKRSGYPAHYAAAIEACASTGGTLMPPVMGAVAFIMASFLGVPYAEVMIAAFLPALLFYLALLFQVDAYAARRSLQGLSAEEIPRLGETLKSGWPYLLSIAMLVYMLLFMRTESHAPYYATVVLLAISLFKRSHRLTIGRLLALLAELARSVGNLVAILAGIGLVVGGLAYTGVAGAFSRELLLYAGGSVPLMLIAGAATSFILGMGMTVSACYIFLAIVLAPALTQLGLNPIAVHLFVLYWGMLSYITPPVAIAAVAAASIAGSKPLETGFMAMRLGAVVFILPFIFVINPALILHGSIDEIIIAVSTSLVSVWMLSSAFERWLYGVGELKLWQAALLLVGGLALMLPEHKTDLIGALIVAGLYLHAFLTKRTRSTEARQPT
jgi:TRAP transporter 4TM/12TM fusion protein